MRVAKEEALAETIQTAKTEAPGGATRAVLVNDDSATEVLAAEAFAVKERHFGG